MKLSVYSLEHQNTNHKQANKHRRNVNCLTCRLIIVIVIARIFSTTTNTRVDFHERIEAGQVFLYVTDAVGGTGGE